RRGDGHTAVNRPKFAQIAMSGTRRRLNLNVTDFRQIRLRASARNANDERMSAVKSAIRPIALAVSLLGLASCYVPPSAPPPPGPAYAAPPPVYMPPPP